MLAVKMYIKSSVLTVFIHLQVGAREWHTMVFFMPGKHVPPG